MRTRGDNSTRNPFFDFSDQPSKQIRFSNLTREEKDCLHASLSIRQSLIETGDPTMRAVDAEKCKMQHMIKALTSEQMKMILLINDLKKEIIESR